MIDPIVNSDNSANNTYAKHDKKQAIVQQPPTRYKLNFFNVLMSELMRFTYSGFTWCFVALITATYTIGTACIYIPIRFNHRALLYNNPYVYISRLVYKKVYDLNPKCISTKTKVNGFWRYTHYCDRYYKPPYSLQSIEFFTSVMFILLTALASIFVIIFAINAALCETKKYKIQISLIAVPRRLLLVLARFCAAGIYIFSAQIVSLLLSNFIISLIMPERYYEIIDKKHIYVTTRFMLTSAICMIFLAAMAYGVGIMCKTSIRGTLLFILPNVIILTSLIYIIKAVTGKPIYESYPIISPSNNLGLSIIKCITQYLPISSINNVLANVELKNTIQAAHLVPELVPSIITMVAWAIALFAAGYFISNKKKNYKN